MTNSYLKNFNSDSLSTTVMSHCAAESCFCCQSTLRLSTLKRLSPEIKREMKDLPLNLPHWHFKSLLHTCIQWNSKPVNGQMHFLPVLISHFVAHHRQQLAGNMRAKLKHMFLKKVCYMYIGWCHRDKTFFFSCGVSLHDVLQGD